MLNTSSEIQANLEVSHEIPDEAVPESILAFNECKRNGYIKFENCSNLPSLIALRASSRSW